MSVNATNLRSRKANIALWVLRVLLAALFLSTASMKFMGGPEIVDEFNTIGLGQWFRLFTAAVELAGAIIILWPAVSAFGALLLLFITIGAFIAQLFVLHGDVIHTIVIGLLAASTIYVQRHQLLRFVR